MQDSLGKVFSIIGNELGGVEWRDVASAEGCTVRTFRELFDQMAKLRFHNPHLNLFFRGQNEDHKQTYDKRYPNLGPITSLRPKAYRSEEIKPHKPEEYFEHILPTYAQALLDELLNTATNKDIRIRIKSMAHFREVLWSVLQHYQVPTPMLDITDYLPVACSFAMKPTDDKPKPTEGFVYVVGLPQIQGLITYSPADSLVLVNLQSACPPEAKRPHHQHGYLVGSLPHNAQPDTYLYRDFALRLVCKFKIVDESETFWGQGRRSTFWDDSGYGPLDEKLLEPDDEVKKMIDSIVARSF